MMLAVSVGLGVTFFKKVNEYLITNPNSFLSSSLNQYKQVLGSGGPGAYKRYRVPR